MYTGDKAKNIYSSSDVDTLSAYILALNCCKSKSIQQSNIKPEKAT